MKLFIIPMLILAGLVLSEELDMAKVLEEERTRMKYDRLVSFKAGAQSRKYAFMQSTKMSRLMDDRNTLYRLACDNLIERGMDASNASNFVTHQMKVESRMRNNKGKKRSQAGRKAIKTSRAQSVDDVCGGAAPKCDPDKPFRNIDGHCNNLKKGKELWGATYIPLRRILDHSKKDRTGMYEYDEKITHWIDNQYKCISLGYPGTFSLPNARLASTLWHSDSNVPHTLATNMLPHIGQLLENDIALTPETNVHDCCTCVKSDDCLTIKVPKIDYYFSRLPVRQKCLDFTRSSLFCQSMAKGRQQMNAITAFVDGSQFYGSDDKTASSLRGPKGTMRVEKYKLLPYGTHGGRVAGNIRAAQTPWIASLQTLFVREHNRIAKELLEDLKMTDYEKIYHNAKRIVAATWQNIVFDEFLPIVLGPEAMKTYKLNINRCSRHRPDIDPSIINSFATAAFRFYHSMIQGFPETYATNDISKPKDKYSLGGNFFNLTIYEADQGKGMEEILQGLTLQPAQAVDRHVTSQLTNHLTLEKYAKFTNDLVARTIQRGRDHGVPCFSDFAKFFNKKNELICWEKMPGTFKTDDLKKLREVFHHPKDMDLFTGGLTEEHVAGALTGEVFNQIMALQFHNLKFGDRFFFTHKYEKGGFNKDARDEIRKRKLANVICDNTDILKMPLNVFKLAGPTNPITDCGKRSKLDINKINLVT